MENIAAPEACREDTLPIGSTHAGTCGAQAAASRMAALRSAVVDEALSDRRRTIEGLRRMVASLEEAKESFDASVAGRLDKTARSWATLAQAAYAQALDEADHAASEGRRMPDFAALAPAPVFHALTGRGVIALTLGSADTHRIEFGLAPGSPVLARGRVLASRGRSAELQLEAGPVQLSHADRLRIEKAVEILLDDSWRLALSTLLDRCRETTIYAAIAADHRAAAEVPAGGGDH